MRGKERDRKNPEDNKIKLGLLALTATSECPFEATGENVPYIRKIEEEQRHSNNAVNNGSNLAPWTSWSKVSIP